MDFHKLVSKLKEIEPTNVFNPQGKATEARPVDRVALSEDAQMRVLAGVSNILEEGRRISDRETVMEKKLTAAEKKKKEEVVTSMKRNDADFKKRYGEKAEEVKHATATKIAKKKAESTEVDVDALIEDEETSEFKKKFNAMVEAKKEYEPKNKFFKKGVTTAEIKANNEEGEKAMIAKFKKSGEKPKPGSQIHAIMKKHGEKVDEASKPDANKDGIPDYAQDGKGANDLGKGAVPKKKKPADKKGMSPAQEKYFGKKNESKMMPKGKKRPVKESIEQKLSFVDCLKIVKESGGQQQIDPVDSALWNWAQRVAANKVGSGIKADAYAARVYESYGGEFQLYDVLSENQK